MKLWTTTIGDGPKHAALIHGVTGDGGAWFEFAPWIAEHGYTVTLVDQRGHGKSPRGESYSAEELADDLVDTLPAGLDLIGGHSLGGRSLLLAVDRLRPRKALYLDPGWVIPEGIVIARPLREDGSLMSVEELGAITDPPRSRGHLEQAIRSNGLFDAAVLEAPNFPLPTILPPDVPVVPSLVVLADPSPLVPEDLRQRLVQGGYEIRVVPGGHHDLYIDDLEATKQAVEDWL